MYRVEVAPDALCQLEKLVLKQLEHGGKTEAYQFLRMFEECVDAMKRDPLSESTYMRGLPKRYRVKNVLPEILLIYQIDEDAASVKIDAALENRTEISN